MVHVLTNLLRDIITPSSVKSLVDDGRSLVVGAVKEILEYTGSIHQLHRWSQDLLGYEFVIIHRDASMMKDVDGLGRYIDVLIHRYLTQACGMRLIDIAKRPFAYSFDSFITCSNLRRFSSSDSTITTEASSILPHFQLFISLHFILLRQLFFNHIPSQNLLLIPFITLFPLKISFCSFLTPLLPLSVHSFLFGLERNGDILQTRNKPAPSSYYFLLLPIYSTIIYNTLKSSSSL